MHSYGYSISLRVFHPTIDPTEITQALGVAPTRAWKSGSPRQTPKGTPLDGVYRETYWHTKLVPEIERSSEDTALEEFLVQCEEQFRPYREFFSRVRSEGGRVELFIGTYGARNYGFELSPSLLASVADLGLSLSFDVYPCL